MKKILSTDKSSKAKFLHILKKQFAFSLVELMISLITISCIAATFAPVITKRLSSRATTVRNQTRVLSNCKDIVLDGKCSLCYPGECIVCNRTCQQTQFLNEKKCVCENCSARTSDGKCTRCVETGCYGCQVGYYCQNNDCTSCTPCPSGMCCPEGVGAPVSCQQDFSTK